MSYATIAPGSSVCTAMTGFKNLARFDEHGESNKSYAQFPGWGVGPKTFVDSVHFTLCESDGGEGEANDFLGNVSYSSPSNPLPLVFNEEVRTGDFTANASASYRIRYRVKAEQRGAPAMTCP